MRSYYEKHRIEICKKTIGIRCHTVIEQIDLSDHELLQKLYQEYPYEKL